MSRNVSSRKPFLTSIERYNCILIRRHTRHGQTCISSLTKKIKPKQISKWQISLAGVQTYHAQAIISGVTRATLLTQKLKKSRCPIGDAAPHALLGIASANKLLVE